uniref:Uncharacterized protein n=1 Tax=Plectus sambesii TaxID=2011161 RepID=A0A914WGQ5_9BILA
MTEFIVTRKEAGIFWIRINRPAKKNAVTPSMYAEITRLLKEASNDSEVLLTALTGTGEYFSSGSDLSRPEGAPDGNDNPFYSYVSALIDHSKPLIALVNGPAIGAAVTVLALFDQVLASDNATFFIPFAQLGITPEACSSYTFPLLMGHQRAASMLLFAEKFSVQQALAVGLVNRVIVDKHFRRESNEFLRSIAKLPHQAIVEGKKLMRGDVRTHLHAVHDLEMIKLAERFKSAQVQAILASKFKAKSKV